jgi:branched-chain amino acid transport system substrate-binding protein
MFGCWETLHVIKQAVEKSGYKDPTPGDYKKLIEALEGMTDFPEGPGHPQGPKKFNGKLHQCYGHQYISKVEQKKLKVVHKTKIEDSLYTAEADYTKQPL